MTQRVKVDVWSDIACPWCFVGKRRFEQGVAALGDGVEVEVEYHSFELAPDTPVDFEGSEVDFLAGHKGMPAAQVEQMLGQMTQVAAGEGLAYDFDALQHTNTRKAHELLHLAKAHGVQPAMKERLLRAYFEQGRHLGRVDELADLAVEVGLDRDVVVRELEAGTYADAVQADVDQAMRYGIGGVPFYVVDGKYGISGAQSPETFAGAIEKAASEQ
ncbi:DsbA family oxidoreductase [Aeromicrobium massiliense]|uniref:DsbA family oxidoreductase n=1 Tax=Aeromicrobium massiliense TaxID=1464554 RepID=UPI0003118E5B|nr:DsbA family oxidoreductase [Aeromicrobium massiliense]